MRPNISTTSSAGAAADFSKDAVRLRIVPGAGALTASYAYLRASSAARRTSATSAVSLAANASLSPRMTCERITPLFPRAPMSAPYAAAALTLSIAGSASRACFTAARIVWSMFVPVSPSGTG